MAHLPAYDCSLALYKKARVVLRPLDNQCHHGLPLFNCLPNQILTIAVEQSFCLIALFRHAIRRHKVDSSSTWICLSAIVHVCITKWWPIAMPLTLAPLLVGNLSRPRPFCTGHYTLTCDLITSFIVFAFIRARMKCRQLFTEYHAQFTVAFGRHLQILNDWLSVCFLTINTDK